MHIRVVIKKWRKASLLWCLDGRKACGVHRKSSKVAVVIVFLADFFLTPFFLANRKADLYCFGCVSAKRLIGALG